VSRALDAHTLLPQADALTIDTGSPVCMVFGATVDAGSPQ
jgi:hypothetical protein